MTLFNTQLKTIQGLKDQNFWGTIPGKKGVVPPIARGTGREKLKTKMNFLAKIAMSCDVWAMEDVWGNMDASNNRIYSALYV